MAYLNYTAGYVAANSNLLPGIVLDQKFREIFDIYPPRLVDVDLDVGARNISLFIFAVDAVQPVIVQHKMSASMILVRREMYIRRSALVSLYCVCLLLRLLP